MSFVQNCTRGPFDHLRVQFKVQYAVWRGFGYAFPFMYMRCLFLWIVHII
jgi:hypothetical protein